MEVSNIQNTTQGTHESLFDDIVLWQGKPLLRPYLINGIVANDWKIYLFITGFSVIMGSGLLKGEKFDLHILLTGLKILTIVCVVETLLWFVSYRNAKYWITKDAVYIQKGILSPKVISVQKKKIIRIDIEKSKAEKRLNAGTIIIDDGEIKDNDGKEEKVYKKLIAIEDPEAVVRLL